MDQYLDFWNLMGYDFAGSWDQVAAHQANLRPSKTNPSSTPFSISAAVDYYVSHGVHSSKIVLGMPLYGRAFANTAGPGQTYSGVGEGTWEQGVWDYKALPLPGAQESHDCDGPDACGASWCYNPATKTLVTYDTPKLAVEKARYVREQGLGGGMWWESSGDKGGKTGSAEAGSLIGTFVQHLGPETLLQGANCLEYPNTKYDNLRKGMPGE